MRSNMAKRTSSSGSWPKPSKARKPPKPPSSVAPRRRDFENLLCEAIRLGVTVELRYDGTDGIDRAAREYGPAAVHYSSENARRVCVAGEVLSNPDEPSKTGPCTFEVGKIVELRIAGRAFKPDPGFDPNAVKYRNGIICKAI